MNIILMRHGEAVPVALNDGDRILTPNGRGEASNTGTQLKQAGWEPQTVFCSTRVRAQQTSELVIGALGLAMKPQVLKESHRKMIGQKRWSLSSSMQRIRVYLFFISQY